MCTAEHLHILIVIHLMYVIIVRLLIFISPFPFIQCCPVPCITQLLYVIIILMGALVYIGSKSNTMAMYLCVVVLVLWITVAPVVNCQAEICASPDPHGYCTEGGVDNCAPKDRLVTSSTDQCRTSFRFAPDHNDILIPPEWELMFDSYDYESLVGPVFLSREFDNDGDVSVRQNVAILV